MPSRYLQPFCPSDSGDRCIALFMPTETAIHHDLHNKMNKYARDIGGIGILGIYYSVFFFYTTRHNFFPAHKAALNPWQPGNQFRCPSQGYRASTAKGSPAAFGIRRPYRNLSSCLMEKEDQDQRKQRDIAARPPMRVLAVSLGTRGTSVPALAASTHRIGDHVVMAAGGFHMAPPLVRSHRI